VGGGAVVVFSLSRFHAYSLRRKPRACVIGKKKGKARALSNRLPLAPIASPLASGGELGSYAVVFFLVVCLCFGGGGGGVFLPALFQCVHGVDR